MIATNYCGDRIYIRQAFDPLTMDLSKLTILQEQYVLRQPLGVPGRYDATYLAWNIINEHDAVVVREYNPSHLAVRSANGTDLVCVGEKVKDLYEYGLNCFEREAAATAMIDHPNVVKQQAFFRENGTAYTVSDYHAGATLSRVLEVQEGKLPEKAAFTIMMPLLNGILAGHRKGLIHGRLSPQQIYLTKSGRPMLLRFHVTQILMARRCGQVSDMSVPGYTPPELLIPEGKKGPWSDVYACGATMYSIITGLKPPEAQARMDVDPFPDTLDQAQGLSKEIKKVLYRAMATDWNERPQSILELKQELLDAISSAKKSVQTASAAEKFVEETPVIKTTVLETPVEEILAPKEKVEQTENKEPLEAFPEAKTATELVSLSRKALARFKVSPEAPLTIGDGGPVNHSDWVTNTETAELHDLNVLQRDIPLTETNPLGPFAGEPIFAEAIEVSEQKPEHLKFSPLGQVIASATASRTRKLSIAAMAACLVLFIVVGLLMRSRPNSTTNTTMPRTAQAIQQPTALPASAQPSYMMLMAQADSMQIVAKSSLLRGDSASYDRLATQATRLYEQILEANPEDSVALQNLRSLSEAIQQQEPVSIISDTPEEVEVLSQEERLNMLAEVYLQEADSLQTRGQLDAAKQKYLLALQYVPELEYALSMIKQIDEQQAQVAADANFDRLFKRGEALRTEGKVEEARAAFLQAQRFNSENPALRDRLEQLDSLEVTVPEEDSQFLALKTQADELFDAGRYSAALISYESAQLLKPEDPFLIARVDAIKDSLNQLERLSQALKNQYQVFVSKGDSLFDSMAFEEAQVHYETALAINPNDEYVKKRLDVISSAKNELEDLATDDNGIFLVPEVAPQMLDESALLAQVVYPRLARNNAIEGRVIVRMIVDEQGRTSRHTVVKGIGYGCDDEAVRILQMARFTPAMYKGKAVKAWHNYPIVFKLLR